jgi:hypothetical protein
MGRRCGPGTCSSLFATRNSLIRLVAQSLSFETAVVRHIEAFGHVQLQRDIGSERADTGNKAQAMVSELSTAVYPPACPEYRYGVSIYIAYDLPCDLYTCCRITTSTRNNLRSVSRRILGNCSARRRGQGISAVLRSTRTSWMRKPNACSMLPWPTGARRVWVGNRQEKTGHCDKSD